MTTRRVDAKSKASATALAQEFEVAAKMRAEETIWVNRIAKELKAQREYGARWGKLSDPRFLELPDQGNSLGKKQGTESKTSWSPWFPRNAPVDSSKARPPSPNGFVPKTYKITSAPAPNDRHSEAEKLQKKIEKEQEKLHLTGLHSRQFDSTLAQVRYKANLTPQQKYYHPVTAAEEYGWVWSRPSLEIYGRSSGQQSATSERAIKKASESSDGVKLRRPRIVKTLH